MNNELFNILFVCTGNTCRSPMAQYIFNKKVREQNLQKQYIADSCGLCAVNGNSVNDKVIKVFTQQHLFNEEEIKSEVAKHMAKQINNNLVEWADLIICMTPEQKRFLNDIIPNDAYKITLLDPNGIVDPFCGDLSDYETSVKQINAAVDELIIKLNKNYSIKKCDVKEQKQ